MMVLHEADIRRKKGPFSNLSKAPREALLNNLTDIIDASIFQSVAVVIDKRRLRERYVRPEHPIIWHWSSDWSVSIFY